MVVMGAALPFVFSNYKLVVGDKSSSSGEFNAE